MQEEISKKINRIKELEKEIQDLDYFNDCIVSGDNTWRNGAGEYRVNCLIKKETFTRLKIFGSKFFGAGVHKQEIRIPNSVLDFLYDALLEYEIELRGELNELLNVKNDNNE